MRIQPDVTIFWYKRAAPEGSEYMSVRFKNHHHGKHYHAYPSHPNYGPLSAVCSLMEPVIGLWPERYDLTADEYNAIVEGT